MPWERRSVYEQRKTFAKEAQGTRNFSALCREYGISRKTGYKWAKREQSGEGMVEFSRRPLHSPNRTDAEVEEKILQLRRENPGWGAKTIHRILEREECAQLPCVKTVNNILKRSGCISEEESAKRKAYIRFQKDHCNEMWQTDFKGEFRMLDGNYCYPLTILDDHSRFSLCVEPQLSTANVVIPTFEKVFSEYGLPLAILSDNGAQFSGFKKGYTRFEHWLMELDILPVHGRIKHPQTQGKIERFHRSMKNELLRHQTFENIDDARVQLLGWREKYNSYRPHEALGMKCPAEIYVPSSRSLPRRIAAYTYSGKYRVVKVNSWGYVRFDRHQIYLSETMIGDYIEFRPSADGERFIACFRNFAIAEFDAASGQLVSRSIARL